VLKGIFVPENDEEIEEYRKLYEGKCCAIITYTLCNKVDQVNDM